MSGTKEGAAKAKKTVIKKYGKDFYSNIGFKGGSQSHPDTRWFHRNPELARICGAKGGKISRRTK